MTIALSPRRLVLQRLLRHRLAQLSLVFLAVLLFLSLAAPLIAELRGIDPSATEGTIFSAASSRRRPSIGWAPTISAAISSSACSTAGACRFWSAFPGPCCRPFSAP